MQEELEIKYDPQVIKLLGIQLYHQFPAVLNELLSNSYDAKAHNVSIVLDKKNNLFKILDDGHGMSTEDLQNKYLVIGRNRRSEGDSKERPATGKKGVGKLAPFGIANSITIITTKDGVTSSYKIQMSEISKSSYDSPYYPEKLSEPNRKSDGTEIIVSEISLNNFSKRDIEKDAESLSRRFHKFGSDFTVTLSDGEKMKTLTNDLYFDSLKKQFEWNIPEDIGTLSKKNDLAPLVDNFKVSGTIFTTETPIKDTTARGIFVFSRGKLASEASFFEARSNEQFHTYATGYLNIDWIDKDNKEDAINTARQGINWEFNDEFRELRSLLQKLATRINRSWRDKRKSSKLEKIEEIIDNDTTSTLKRYRNRIQNDKAEKARYDSLNEVLAEILETTDNSVLEEKIVQTTLATSKPARQDASPNRALIPDVLKNINASKNIKIERILNEVKAPIIADKEEEFINSESLLLRCLIDAGTSAYLINNLSLLKNNINKDNPQDKNKKILEEAQIWYHKHPKTNPDDIEDNFNFADKYKTVIRLLKIDHKITNEEKNSFIQAFVDSGQDRNNVVKNLNMAMHSPNGMINFSELKQHWADLAIALQKIIENI